MDTLDYAAVRDSLVKQLKNFLGDKKAVVGISGGIDSAVVASLCVRAVGKDRVIGIQMPYGDQSTEDGSLMLKNLGVKDRIINIKHIVQEFPQILPSIDQNKIINRLTNGNMRARVRMILLYAYAGANNGLVIGTGNKTELMLGYETKYGDGGVDVEPIGDLYKTRVYKLAETLDDIPCSIVKKAPSAELWEGQTDEGEIGMTYVEMDGILMALEGRGYTMGQMVDFKSKYGESKVDTILFRINNSAHKRSMPPTFLIK